MKKPKNVPNAKAEATVDAVTKTNSFQGLPMKDQEPHMQGNDNVRLTLGCDETGSAYLLKRFSTAAQGSGSSVDRQVVAATKAAARAGLRLKFWVVDAANFQGGGGGHHQERHSSSIVTLPPQPTSMPKTVHQKIRPNEKE